MDHVGPILKTTSNGTLQTTATISGDVNVDETNLGISGTMVGKPAGAGGDFTTAWAAATQITAGMPAYYPNLRATDILIVQQVNAAGAVVNTYSRDDAAMTVAGNVITVAGATFANTDVFLVFTNVQKMAFEGGVVDAQTQRVTIADDDTNLADIKTAVETLVTDIDDGLAIPNATHISPVDFTATYTSNVTITLAGLPFTITDNSQVIYIVQVNDTAHTSHLWVNGVNCTLEEAANVVTLTADDGSTPFTANDVFVVGINAQKKAYDPTIDSLKTTEQSPIQDQYTDSVTLVTDSDIGAVDDTWVDQGAEIDMRGKTGIAFFVTYTANDSTGPLLQILSKDESGGTVEYDLEDTSAYQKTPTDGMTIVYDFETKNRIPFLQVQTKATDVDTGGGTEGTITIKYTTSWE